MKAVFIFGNEHDRRWEFELGAEDHGLPAAVLDQCDATVSLESVGPASYSVAVAGTLVMYDRVFREGGDAHHGRSTVAKDPARQAQNSQD